jgi:hypothetical protein
MNKVRYIVFAIDTRFPQYLGNKHIDHINNGKIFSDVKDAREYARDLVNDNECVKFVLGEFILEPAMEIMYINQIETFGFKNSKSNINQMKLFE